MLSNQSTMSIVLLLGFVIIDIMPLQYLLGLAVARELRVSLVYWGMAWNEAVLRQKVKGECSLVTAV